MQTSASANAASQGNRARRPRSAPVRAAIGSSTSAPSATRDQATNAGGTPWFTAILMNRYGTPQMRDIAAKSVQARADTAMPRGGGSAPAARQPPGGREHGGSRCGLDKVARDEVGEAVGDRPAQRLVRGHREPRHADHVDDRRADQEQRERGE